MARPKKSTVDYFPHYTRSGKTIFILEAEFGNDGYSFWFKLLETLGSTDGMVFDWGNTVARKYLLAKAKVDEETALRIIELLAEVDAIDRELWEKRRLLWSQNLVDNVRDAFKRRSSVLPQRPEIGDDLEQMALEMDVGDAEIAVEPPETGRGKPRRNGEEKHRYAEFVTLKGSEYQKLVDQYGEVKTRKMIEVLNNYKGSKGKKYKSDYHAILNWVVNRVNEEPQNRMDRNKQLLQRKMEEAKMLEQGGNSEAFGAGHISLPGNGEFD